MDLSIARARIALSVATLLAIYVDPAIGGLFVIDARTLAILLAYLAYGLLVHEAVRRNVLPARLPALSVTLDVLFAVLLAIFTEGHTSPAFAFFAFAIIAASTRAGFRTTLAVTLASVLLYFVLLTFLARETRDLYLMRPVYLAVTGYLIGFLGQQHAKQQAQIAERHHIACFLHDGYVQGLAGINLRLETARELLRRDQPAEAGDELRDLQAEVTREFDAVRIYIRTLADAGGAATPHAAVVPREPHFSVHADFEASGRMLENVLHVILEATRNTRSHAGARSGAITAVAHGRGIRITVDDDGVGFPGGAVLPWSIASRIGELGGRCGLIRDTRPGAHLEVEMPSA
jgi:signal transduction histidine kinase